MTTVNELLDRYIPEHLPTLARRTQIDTLRYVRMALHLPSVQLQRQHLRAERERRQDLPPVQIGDKP